MKAYEVWFHNGVQSAPVEYGSGVAAPECQRRLAQGAVRVVHGALGSEIKWDCDSPCHAALFAAMENLADWEAPLLLRYWRAGWAEEKIATPQAARERIEMIMYHADRPLLRTLLFEEGDAASAAMPQQLQRCFLNGHADPHISIDCLFDPHLETYVVERVGRSSIIGRLFGTSVLSPPCNAFGHYGAAMTARYDETLMRGEPCYDEVLVLLMMPDNIRRWVPYHRIIIPKVSGNKRRAVTIVSEFAPVSLKPV